MNICIETIISVHDLNSIGFLVTFEPTNAFIQHLVYNYRYNLICKEGLFYLNIHSLKPVQPSPAIDSNGIASIYHAKAPNSRVIDFHNRFAHISKKNMLIACKPSGSIYNSNITSEDIHNTFKNWTCLTCAVGKRNTPSIPLNLTPPLDIIGHTISADILPAINPISINGDNWAFLFTCVYCRLEKILSSAPSDCCCIL